MELYDWVEEPLDINAMVLKYTKIISCIIFTTFIYIYIYIYNQIQPQNKKGLHKILIKKLFYVIYDFLKSISTSKKPCEVQVKN